MSRGPLIVINYDPSNGSTSVTCTILNILWSEFVTNIEVFEKAKITNMPCYTGQEHLLDGQSSPVENHLKWALH